MSNKNWVQYITENYPYLLAQEEEDGRWITLDNGTHVFIKEGESVEQTIMRLKGGEGGKSPLKEVPVKVKAKISQNEAEHVRLKVQGLVNKLPSRDTKGIPEISISDNLGMYDWGGGELSPIGATYNPVTQEIQLDIETTKNLEGSTLPVLSHEVGHHVYDKIIDKENRGLWIDVFYYKSKDDVFYGSGYALHNPSEAFAETYSMNFMNDHWEESKETSSISKTSHEILKTLRGVKTDKMSLFEFKSELSFNKIGKSTIDLLIKRFKEVNEVDD